MSSISSVANSAPSAQAGSTTAVASNDNSASSLTNEFLTLMVAQINNQNPLEPQDGTEFVSQLAQFSQVESAESLVTLTKNNQILLDNLQVMGTSNLVNQPVSVRTDTISANGKDNIKGSIELKANSNVVNLTLTDALGQSKTVSLGSNKAGMVDFELNTEELGLNGEFSVQVDVDEGQGYSPTVMVNGTVEKVTIPSSGGSALLSVTGVGDVPYYEITQFG